MFLGRTLIISSTNNNSTKHSKIWILSDETCHLECWHLFCNSPLIKHCCKLWCLNFFQFLLQNLAHWVNAEVIWNGFLTASWPQRLLAHAHLLVPHSTFSFLMLFLNGPLELLTLCFHEKLTPKHRFYRILRIFSFHKDFDFDQWVCFDENSRALSAQLNPHDSVISQLKVV